MATKTNLACCRTAPAVQRGGLPLPTALLLALLLALPLAGAAVAQETQADEHERYRIVRDADVPDLPFEDNPDPLLCGIPEPFGEPNQAFLRGYYQGELIQDQVLLYDSHLRRRVVGSAPHGTEIEVLLYQANPALDYYLVRSVGLEVIAEGWIPEPFVRFPDEPDPAVQAR